jgi:hypothetical protein
MRRSHFSLSNLVPGLVRSVFLASKEGASKGGKLVAVLTQRRTTNQELSFVRRSVAVLWLIAGRLEECHTTGSPKLG